MLCLLLHIFQLHQRSKWTPALEGMWGGFRHSEGKCVFKALMIAPSSTQICFNQCQICCNIDDILHLISGPNVKEHMLVVKFHSLSRETRNVKGYKRDEGYSYRFGMENAFVKYMKNVYNSDFCALGTSSGLAGVRIWLSKFWKSSLTERELVKCCKV